MIEFFRVQVQVRSPGGFAIAPNNSLRYDFSPEVTVNYREDKLRNSWSMVGGYDGKLRHFTWHSRKQ